MTNLLEVIQQSLLKSDAICLMVVVDSQGSAPGRVGFNMIVGSNGDLKGSIGGGLMEFNLVELAKTNLAKGKFSPFKIKQVHNRKSSESSGMVCSGSQQIAFYYLDKHSYLELEKHSLNNKYLQFNQFGLNAVEEKVQNHVETDSWNYCEDINIGAQVIHLFGAGHVSIPTCKILKSLGFKVHLYDNRHNLNTFESNTYVDEKTILDFINIKEQIQFNPKDFIILMNHKYIEDKMLLSQLIDLSWCYLGVLGSKNKIRLMYKELMEEGIDEADLNKVHAPIGLDIKSETPEEIAVSIAAELIQVRNKKQ